MQIENLKFKIIFIVILLVGAFFRFYNLNWDQNQHLHPDERFLTMVGNAMKIPKDIFSYIDPQKSSMNPTNVGFGFFAYGVFPLTLNKIIAVLANNDNYNGFTIQGRFLSALFDFLTILVIYKIVKLFENIYKINPLIKYFACFLYAIAVLPIQLSHFFIVDTFLNFFALTSFYFALLFGLVKKVKYIILSSLFLGIAISSKVNGIFILPLNLFFIFYAFFVLKESGRNIFSTRIFRVIAIILAYFLILYLSLRIFDPHLFKNSNFFDLSISPTFHESIKSLNSLTHKDAWFPPSVQWINKPTILFSLYNIALFGIGLPSFIFLFIGVWYTIKKRKFLLTLMVVWALLLFLYQSTQFVQTMRYFLILYPFIAIFAAFGISYAIQKLPKIIKILVFVIFMFWPLAFLSIYTKDHTRIEASKWIYENILPGKTIAWEHWDDPLPLLLPNYAMQQYYTEQLPVFDPDTPEKLQKINNILLHADYYILSSNRAWGSIPTVPEKYPFMKKFYDDLFAEKRGFTKIKEFTSYPSLDYLGIPLKIIDDIAEENFTVYDHPKVLIFKRVN